MIEECFAAIEPLLGTKTACAAVGQAAGHPLPAEEPRQAPGAARPARRRRTSSPPTRPTTILGVLRSPRFVDCSPAQVYFTLLDEGIYLASESSLLPVAAVERRGPRAASPGDPPGQGQARAAWPPPPAVWSWDITKLKGPARGSTTTSTSYSTSSAATSSPGASRRRSPANSRESSSQTPSPATGSRPASSRSTPTAAGR